MPPKRNDEEYQNLKKAVAQLKKDIAAQLGDAEAAQQPLSRAAEALQAPKQQTALKRRRILKGHFGKVYALQWSDEDSKHLVSAAQDGKLIVWNGYTTNKELAINLPSGYVMTCAYSPAGKMVACGGLDNLCTVFRIPAESGTVFDASRSHAVLQQHEGYLACCRFVDEQQMLTASGDSTCILWDIEGRVPKMIFNDHTGDVMTISVSPSGWFISGACDSTSKLWDFRQERCAQTFSGHSADINAVDCGPDGYTFATGSDDNSCRLFDVRACRQLNKYVHEDLMCPITSVSFSRSGKMLFAGYDNFNCAGWDAQWATLSDRLANGHDNRVSCVGVNKAGNALATGSWDTLLQIWA